MSTVTIRFVPPKRRPSGRLEDGLRDFRGDVPPERGADEVTLAEPLEHGVERLRQPADLVPRRHRKRLGEVARRDARHAAREEGDGPRQAAEDQEPEHERGESADARREQERVAELVKPVEVDLDRIGHVEEGLRAPLPVEDRREGRRSRARPDGGRRACSGPRRPPGSIPWARSARARAGRGRPAGRVRCWRRPAGPPAAGWTSVEDGDRARQERLVLDRGHGPARAAGSRRSPATGSASTPTWSRGSSGARHAGDVEELRPDGVLDLALLARVGHGLRPRRRPGTSRPRRMPPAGRSAAATAGAGAAPPARFRAAWHGSLGPCARHRLPRMRRRSAAVHHRSGYGRDPWVVRRPGARSPSLSDMTERCYADSVQGFSWAACDFRG